MKIAIASDDWVTISSHLGNNKGYVIFELEGSKIKSQEYRSSNIPAQEVELNGPVRKVDKNKRILKAIGDCDVLILKRSEERQMNGISISSFNIVLTDETFVENVLDLYLSDFLIKNDINQ